MSKRQTILWVTFVVLVHFTVAGVVCYIAFEL